MKMLAFTACVILILNSLNDPEVLVLLKFINKLPLPSIEGALIQGGVPMICDDEGVVKYDTSSILGVPPLKLIGRDIDPSKVLGAITVLPKYI